MNITSSIYVYLIYKKKKKIPGVENYQRCLFILKHLGGAVIPSAFLCYAYAHQLNAITYIHLFLSIILTLSASRPIIQFGINISTSVSHRCSPLFIGIHLFIHSLSHLASEGLTWRSLRPSKVKVKRTYKPPRPKNPKFSAQRVS